MGGAVFTRSGLAALVFAGLSAAPASSSMLEQSPRRASNESASGTIDLTVRDEEGRPLIARAQLSPVNWTERVRLGQWHDTNVLSDLDGVRITLRPGRYRMHVSCGPEWSLVTRTLEVMEGDRLVQRIGLRHQVSLPGWVGADLHVHTQHSDDAKERGGVSVLDLRAEGISMAAVTDHNHIGGLGAGIDSLSGAELTTWDPEVGHFNAFPLRRLPPWEATTPAKLFAALATDPEVFVQINHPRLEDHIAYFALGGFDGKHFADPNFHLDVDGLEVWNGYDVGHPREVDRLLTEWRSWVAAGHRLTATGGSDSHGAGGHLPGYPRTYARTSSVNGLGPALKQGHAFVTNGPLLDLKVEASGQRYSVHPGDDLELIADSRPTLSVQLTILAPDWMEVEQAELWLGDELAWRANIPKSDPGEPLRFDARVQLAVHDERTLQAVARGGSGLEALLGRKDVQPLAFTNPVYIHYMVP